MMIKYKEWVMIKMPLNFINLDLDVRSIMIQEVEHDIANGRLFYSPRLNDKGRRLYPELLRNAISNGNDDLLANSIMMHGCLKETEERHLPTKTILAKVPSNAHVLIGEGEFNRFYIRALCIKSINEGLGELQVYRAKAVSSPRPDSIGKIGMFVDPYCLLQDLRDSIGDYSILGVPNGPNSGLSVRLRENESMNDIS